MKRGTEASPRSINGDLSMEVLSKVVGGVSSQVSDSTCAVNTKVIGDAPAISMGEFSIPAPQAMSAAEASTTSSSDLMNLDAASTNAALAKIL